MKQFKFTDFCKHASESVNKVSFWVHQIKAVSSDRFDSTASCEKRSYKIEWSTR